VWGNNTIKLLDKKKQKKATSDHWLAIREQRGSWAGIPNGFPKSNLEFLPVR